MLDQLMSIEDVAEVLMIPVGTLRKWRHNDEGPRAFRVGRHIRYRESEVQRWIEEREAKHDRIRDDWEEEK